MSFAYIAAEYFVDAICISRDYKITFDYVKILRNLIGKDINPRVAEYLDKKSKHDSLYIFKKFPDVFSFEGNSIGLTKEFLSLYNLNKYSVSKRFHIINCYVKNCAIEYFRKILMTQGPKPYLELFNMLMIDHTQKYAKYFFHFSATDILEFFMAHPNYFSVIHNHVVFLTARNPVQTYSFANDQEDTEAMKIFEISVYFLLTCFDTLHYFHLKQILSYVLTSTNHILGQISLVRQRELFAILPVVTMNASGFVSLKNKEISVALPEIIKTILLLVSILAFKKEMYIVDLVAEFSNRMLPALSHFSDLTFDQQMNFIRNYPMYFHISYTGHISLSPEFILSECPSLQSSKHESDLQIVEKSVKETGLNQFSDNSSTACLPNASPVNMPKNTSSTITSHAEEVHYTDSSLIPKDLCLPELNETVIKRIKQSFFYLSKCFYLLDMKRAMQTLLHAVDDVRISFCSFSDKSKFISECCNFINSLSEEYRESIAGRIDDLLTEKEKHLLFITYILDTNETIHFVKLIEAMEKHKIDSILLKSTVSDQFKYFKTLSGYIEVYSDGQIIFPSTFFPIKSIIDSFSSLFSDFEHESGEILPQNEKQTKEELLQDQEPSAVKAASEDKKPLMLPNNKTDKFSKTLSWVADVVPLKQKSSSNASEDNDNSSFINLPIEIPDTIRKTLSHCAKLLNKYYECAATIHILKATLFSFSYIYNYLYNLPLMSDQYAFAEKCFNYLNKVDHHYSSPLSSEEREILFITYLLLVSEDRRMHYRKIVTALASCHCKRMEKLTVDRSQYWYFRKAVKYFVINSDGFVSLSSEFNYIEVCVNIAMNRTAKSQNLKKQSYHISEDLCKINPEQLPKKNVMTGELSADSSSNYFPVRNKNSEKVEIGESQFEIEETNPERINIDADTKDVITDVVFFFLSVCEKMSVEKLCYRLNSFNIKGVHNMFSSCTITEKLKFFKSLSSYFEVSKDGFVSLKTDAVQLFVPKTDVNLSELFRNNSSRSERSPSMSRSRSESVKSTDVSEFSVSVSTASGNNVTKRRRRRRSGSKKHENKISYEIHKVTDEAELTVKKSFDNSSLDLQSSCSPKDATKSEPSSVISKEKECNIFKEISKDDETSTSAPEIEIIMELKGTKNESLLTGANSHMSIDQVSEFSDKKDEEEKIVESQCKLMTNSLEETKTASLYIPTSGDTHNLKVPRQPIKESISSKLSKSSSALHPNTSESKSKYREMDNSSIGSFTKIPFVTNCEVEVKSNLSSPPACVKASLSDVESISSFKEIDDALQTCSMPLGDNFHNDLQNDSSYQAYISDLIDEFLYSARTKPSDAEASTFQVTCTDNKESSSALNSATAQTAGIKSQVLDVKENSTLELENEPESTKASKTVSYQTLVSILKNCDKAADVSNTVTSNKPELTAQSDSDLVADFETVIEDRAVTFFSIMLKNYQQYDESISANFLKTHVTQASAEVQSFMFKHYGHDFIPFFQKHNKVFYVSPITRCVYLAKKSSQKLRLNLS